MVSAILQIIFTPFSFVPVLYCAGFALTGAIFGLIGRFLRGNFDMGVR